jgi:glycosyltransferase involved in cell wall biosynthesis
VAKLPDATLVLFMTDGMSLAAWDRIGMFEREVALYRALRPHLAGLRIVTYGGREDVALGARLPGIDVACNRWGLPHALYRLLVSRLHPRTWRGTTVVKSNQVRGADLALRAARTAGAPFVARCGYLHAEFAERRHGPDASETHAARALERAVFTGADRVVVTTEAMRDRVRTDYGVEAAVIPNYVETERFRPGDRPTAAKAATACFVGRLSDQKNPVALVEALGGLGIDLMVAGDGPLRADMERRARENGVTVTFRGNVPNAELPALLGACDLFVLPSHYEGHPKTLLEAMACGMPVVGTDVPGIREVIRHGDTGYLCGTSAPELRKAVVELAGDPALRKAMGERARAYVVERLSLERTVARELALLEEVLAA